MTEFATVTTNSVGNNLLNFREKKY